MHGVHSFQRSGIGIEVGMTRYSLKLGSFEGDLCSAMITMRYLHPVQTEDNGGEKNAECSKSNMTGEPERG